MKKSSLVVMLFLTAVLFAFTSASEAANEPGAAANTQQSKAVGRMADTSQQFTVGSLPEEIIINLNTVEKDSADTQPRLKYLKFTGLRVAEDGKTVEFNIENSFDLPDAEDILLGGLMLSSMVRYDYDGGEKLHTAVLFKDKRVILEQGVNTFKTDPATYPNVASIEKLQFFLMPPRTDFIRKKQAVSDDVADTSQAFSVANLPNRIVVDRNTIAQNASQRDPRLEYIEIRDLQVGADGKTVEFSVENIFQRQKLIPIHVGSFMVTGMARYGYDNGAELHSTVLLSQMQVTFEKGTTKFKTDPGLYPLVTKLESVQFYFTPVSRMLDPGQTQKDILGSAN
nr:hypothetical protein [Desulfobulbaceae bacterium]